MEFEHDKKEYASKGIAGTALGLGIGAAALWLLNGNGAGGILGGNNNYTHAELDIMKAKECEDNLALTRAIYETRITDLKEKSDLFVAVNNRLVELEKKEAQTAIALPLMFQLANCQSERYADAKFCEEEKARNTADWMLQSEICKKVDGQMGLPFSSIITGVPTLPNLQYIVGGCNNK